jgi:hypothetical protein
LRHPIRRKARVGCSIGRFCQHNALTVSAGTKGKIDRTVWKSNNRKEGGKTTVERTVFGQESVWSYCPFSGQWVFCRDQEWDVRCSNCKSEMAGSLSGQVIDDYQSAWKQALRQVFFAIGKQLLHQALPEDTLSWHVCVYCNLHAHRAPSSDILGNDDPRSCRNRPLVIAAVAALEMTAESCGSTHLDRGHDAPLSGG